MGTVYQCWDTARQATCAVKVLRQLGPMQKEAARRFVDEARLIARLHHPYVVEIFDSGITSDSTPFLVMELLDGQDLEAYLLKAGPLPLAEAQHLVKQIGFALHAIHEAGVVHRDIKPKNIFLVGEPTARSPGSVKLIDFGLAKDLEGRHIDRGSAGMLIGTPQYLAPESWSGEPDRIDAHVDQWALAVLAFRMLSGRLPYDSQIEPLALGRQIQTGRPRRIRDLRPDVPDFIDRALSRAMSLEKEARFASVKEFIWAFTNHPARLAPLPPLIAEHHASLFSDDTLRTQSTHRMPVEPGPADSLPPQLTVVFAAKPARDEYKPPSIPDCQTTVLPIASPFLPTEPGPCLQPLPPFLKRVTGFSGRQLSFILLLSVFCSVVTTIALSRGSAIADGRQGAGPRSNPLTSPSPPPAP
jgi:serine/threonine protein kinase